MRSRALLALIFFIAVLAPSAAQNDPSLNTGLKPYGSYQGGDLDSVSLTNGNLTLHLPLATYPQRGSLGYSPRVIYNSKGGWYVVPNCNSVTGVCSPFWAWGANPKNWSNQASGMILDLTPEDAVSVGWVPNGVGYRFVAGTSDGSMHQLVANQAGGMSTLDGTAIWYDGSNPVNGQGGIRRDHNGNRNASTSLEDPNGNIISFGSPLLDTLNRSFPGGDHIQELTNTSQSFQNLRDSLSGALKDPKLGDTARQTFTSTVQKLDKAIGAIKTIKSIQKIP